MPNFKREHVARIQALAAMQKPLFACLAVEGPGYDGALAVLASAWACYNQGPAAARGWMPAGGNTG